MRFKEWMLSEGKKYLHTIGFMDSNRSVIGAMLDGVLRSNTGLIFLRPASFKKMLLGPQYGSDTVWVELGRDPKLLAVKNLPSLFSFLGMDSSGKDLHTDIPEIAMEVARRLRAIGYDGYTRQDFPEIAVLSDVPNKIVGRLEGDFYYRDPQGKVVKVPGKNWT